MGKFATDKVSWSYRYRSQEGGKNERITLGGLNARSPTPAIPRWRRTQTGAAGLAGAPEPRKWGIRTVELCCSFPLRCRTPHKNQRIYSLIQGLGRKDEAPPKSRSIETMGTSPRRHPAASALTAISKAKAQPTGRLSSPNSSNRSRRNILMPVVRSDSAERVRLRKRKFAVVERTRPRRLPPSRPPPCA